MAITRKDLNERVILLDGAMGTMLQNVDVRLNKTPEIFNIENPDIVVDIHKKYIKAGSNIITTNTFGANRVRLRDNLYSVEDVIKAAIINAKKAVKEASSEDVSIALDIGPLGELLKPLGRITFEEAYDIFKEVVLCGEKYGVDLYIIETMYDLNEMKSAVLAVKDNSKKMIFATMTFNEDGKTFTKVSPEEMCKELNNMDIDALGVNCSVGPKNLRNIVDEILNNSKYPVIVQPNMGIPRNVGNKFVYDVSIEEYVGYMTEFIEKGVSIVGGCCGTTDKYIEELNKAIFYSK